MVYILLLVPIHIYRPKIKLSSVTRNAHISEHPKFFQEYSLVTRCQARCYFVAKVSHPKDGASLGESTRGKIFPLAENLRSAQQRKEDDALLLADEDGDACLSYDDLAGLAVGGTHDVQSFAG